MSRTIPYDTIPDKMALENNTVYQLKGTRVVEKFWGDDGFVEAKDDPDNNAGGIYCIQLGMQVAKDDPSGMGGTFHDELFFIGNSDDPSAEDPKTWRSKGAMQFKKFVEAARVTQEGTLEDFEVNFRGSEFLGLAKTREDKNGVERARLAKVWPLGEQDVGPIGGVTTGG